MSLSVPLTPTRSDFDENAPSIRDIANLQFGDVAQVNARGLAGNHGNGFHVFLLLHRDPMPMPAV